MFDRFYSVGAVVRRGLRGRVGRWIVFIGMTSVLAAFLIAVPAPWSTVLFLLISLSAVLVAVGIPWLRQRQRQGLMFHGRCHSAGGMCPVGFLED